MFGEMFKQLPIKSTVMLLGIGGVVTLFMLNHKRKPGNFEGYVCEKCGQPYNACEHRFDEDYTLVRP